MQYVDDIKNLRALILNDLSQSSKEGKGGQEATATGQSLQSQSNRENVLRKAMRYQQLEDDNKKLRKLLKMQIENSEQLREDTHQTIETLRQEFDILVQELLQYKQNDAAKNQGTKVPTLTGHAANI